MSFKYDRTWLEEDDVDAPYFDPNRTPVSDIETVGIPTDRPWWSDIPLIGNIYESPVHEALEYFGNIPFVQDVGGATKPLRQITGALDPLGVAQTILGMGQNKLDAEGIEYDLSNVPYALGQYFTGQEGAITPDDKRVITGVNRPFDEDDYDSLMNQIAGMDFADPFMQDEIIKATMSDLGEVPEETGPGWNPNGLTNLLQDQIGFINELTAAGILNVEDARAATEQRLDEVWGDLQAGFQSELDDLVAGDEAAAASLGATTDSIAADLADMGVDAAVLDPERRAMEEMLAMQASNEMNFAEGLRDSAAFGQADRRSSVNFGMDDLILNLEMAQLQQTGQLENMAEMAQMQGSAMGVDPALIFADMLSGTSVAQQMAAGNASASADANMMSMAEYLAAAVPDFGGDPMLAYMTLNGMLPGNYFKPDDQGFLDSLQPGVIGALQAEIQAIMQNNQNISFQDATRIAVDSLYNLGE